MRQKQRALTVRIPEAVYDDAHDLANVLGRPLRQFVQDAIEQRVKQLKTPEAGRLIRQIRAIRLRDR